MPQYFPFGFDAGNAGSHRFPHGSLRVCAVPPALSRWRRTIMPTYRAYLINGDDRVTSYKPVDADTDADALKAARRFAEGCDVEVWLLDRKIGRLERTRK